MKIAIPTNDGFSISSNTKYLKGFKTFEIVEGKVINESFLTGLNQITDQEISFGPGELTANPLVKAIEDCKLVISNGLDKKLFEDLLKAHKEVYITDATEVRIAVRRFIYQTLRNHPELCV
jgi:hypothetical protein